MGFAFSKSMQSKEITPQHVITFRWGRILLDQLIPSTQGYSSSWAREWLVTRGVYDITNYLPKIFKNLTDFFFFFKRSNSASFKIKKVLLNRWFLIRGCTYFENISISQKIKKWTQALSSMYYWLVFIYSCC